jgi:hypothetical protein
MLISAIGINFFMKASGNDVVIYYLPEVFKVVGIRSKKKLLGINVIIVMNISECPHRFMAHVIGPLHLPINITYDSCNMCSLTGIRLISILLSSILLTIYIIIAIV